MPGARISFEPREWPRAPASAAVLCLVVVTALALNLASQSHMASVAGAIAATGCAAVVLTTTSNRSREVYGALALVVLLSLNLILRTSAWVTVPTLLALSTFILLAASAHVFASRPFVVLRVGFRWLENLIMHSVPWLTRPAIEASRRDSVQLRSVVRGGVIAVGIGSLLVLLLAAADSVFAALLGGLADSSVWSHIFLVVVFTILVGAIGATASSSEPLPDAEPKLGRFGVEGFMGLVTINAVLATWCATQLFVALGQADQILQTEGLTRAEYARRGFFELVAVAVVVVALLNLLERFTERTSRRANQLFTGLGILAVLETIVLVAITYGRLDFYMDAFGLTMLRLSVACFLGWLAAVLLLVAVRLANVGGTNNWTAMASLTLAGLITVGFGWANPEAVVTNYNTGQSASALVDGQYLASLSADAQPALIDNIDSLDPAAVRSIKAQLCRPEPASNTYWVFSWNWSRSKADSARSTLSC